MRISDWSSDVCSSDLAVANGTEAEPERRDPGLIPSRERAHHRPETVERDREALPAHGVPDRSVPTRPNPACRNRCRRNAPRRQRGPPRSLRKGRSEEHTSELQSLMRISYAVFCLKKKKQKIREQ